MIKMNYCLYIKRSVVGILLAFTSTAGFGQTQHQSAYNLALGGGGTAYQDGYNANFVNPANLMLNHEIKPRLTLGIIGGISTNVGGSLINIGVYNEYFTKGYTIKGEVADNVLGAWFGANSSNSRNMGFEFNMVPIGISYRGNKWAASIAVRTRTMTDMSISRGMAEFILFGLNGDNFNEPRHVNFDMRTTAFHELSAGYARQAIKLPSILPFVSNMKLYVGAAPKLLIGSFTSNLDFNSTLQVDGTELIRHDFNYTFQTIGSLSEDLNNYIQQRDQQGTNPDISDYVDPDGNDLLNVNAVGLGIDLGTTLEMDIKIPVLSSFFRGPQKLRVGLSLTDLGKLTYEDKVGNYSANDVFEWKGFEFDEEKIDEEYNGDRGEYMNHVLTDSIGSNIYGSFNREETGSIVNELPTKLNFGAHLMMGKLSVMADLTKGFTDLGSSSERVSFSLGAEYRLFGFLPLRAGMRTGGYSSTSYSAGTGLEFRNFEFSFAGSVVANSISNGSSIAAAWSGIVLRF